MFWITSRPRSDYLQAHAFFVLSGPRLRTSSFFNLLIRILKNRYIFSVRAVFIFYDKFSGSSLTFL